LFTLVKVFFSVSGFEQQSRGDGGREDFSRGGGDKREFERKSGDDRT
jgi:hypothetical protein